MMKPEQILAGIVRGDRRSLSKAITLVESHRPDHREQALWLMNHIPLVQDSLRIGISGPPGVGKSTFIETFGLKQLAQGHKVAVLAVDPSSSLTHGSILGDKTRMPQLATHPDSFIRPSPAGETLGGVTRRTREAIFLCEAAGFDRIIVETVGVGQSETAASSMVDLFLLLQLPNAGDDLQGIKKGILEIADLVLINKTDGNQVKAAKRAQSDLQSALGLVFRKEQIPQVLCCSALEKKGMDDVNQAINAIIKTKIQDGRFLAKRQNQALQWFDQGLREEILFALQNNPQFSSLTQQIRQQVHQLKKTPSTAIQEILKQFTIYIQGTENE
ncbi:MAG: methylmalonyl Co-A mutase-associated GTPase MeaB [Oligoflexus sp.]